MTDTMMKGDFEEMEEWLLNNGIRIDLMYSHKRVELRRLLDKFRESAYDGGYRDGQKAGFMDGYNEGLEDAANESNDDSDWLE